uniref:Uncharacterized protein n=1 Tax=Arundo donax TaxID=35708 RepID=A0A0A9ACL8_ARUDO
MCHLNCKSKIFSLKKSTNSRAALASFAHTQCFGSALGC